MTWLVFGVSVLLVAAGAASIVTGMPIVQIERGWTEVIAGSVVLSSGFVVFALAVVSLHVQRLRGQLATPPAAVAVPAPVLPDPVVAAPEPQPEPEPPLPVERPPVRPHVVELVGIDEQSSTDEVSEQRHGLWKRVRRPGDETPVADRGEPEPRDRIEPEAFGFNPRPPVESQRAVDPTHTSEAPVDAPPVLPPDIPSTAPLQAPDGRADEPAFGWMDRALFRTKSTKPIERAVEPLLPALATEPEAATSPVNPVEPETSNPFAFRLDARPPEPAAVVPEPPGDAEPSPPSADITEIGRYQAGSASYVMYSDGTIEVEIEGGDLHRFGSMEELKAFIASQDSPVI